MHPSKWTLAAGESSWTRPSRTLRSAIVRAHRWTPCSSISVPAESRPAVMEVMMMCWLREMLLTIVMTIRWRCPMTGRTRPDCGTT